MKIVVRRLAYGLGAEVSGVDLRMPLDQETVAAIRGAWLDNLVLVFPRQDITFEQHIAFSRHFGELELHPLLDHRGDQHPEIYKVSNEHLNSAQRRMFTETRVWHSDGAFTLRPPTGSLLHSHVLPSVGGSTEFVSMYMAYETLSPAMKKLAEQLRVVNDAAYSTDLVRSAEAREQRKRDIPPVVHDMVRVHPETGKKALYLNRLKTRQIEGLSIEDSRPVLERFFENSERPEFVYRHIWRVHDLVMWDNRCIMHRALADFNPDENRTLYRTTLKGQPLGALYQEPWTPEA